MTMQLQGVTNAKMIHDPWVEHVRLEIIDATFDPDRLLEITEALTTMEDADLIPEEYSSHLFNLITIHNS